MSDVERLVAKRIVQLHKSGVPSSHIARRLGCERKMVSRAIREWMRVHGNGGSTSST